MMNLLNRRRALPVILLALVGVAASSEAAFWNRKPREKTEAAVPAKPNEPTMALPVPPPDDTARFLAGMPVAKNSPLFALTQDPAWSVHAQYYETAFARLNKGKLQKLRDWQDAFLPEAKQQYPVAYYMFSGPDFLFVDQFFPNASTYIMCGKESMGPPPDPTRVTNLSAALGNLRFAMKDSLRTTYFITQDMKVGFEAQQFRGTIPILYVFLVRANKTIRDVSFVSVDRGGGLHQSAPGKGGTAGVRINYVDNRTHRPQTLFYFTTDISDGGISSNPGFMNFCHGYGVGVSFLKASSYLMFEGGFNRVRDFVLNHSQMIVQDDSGIPLKYFNRDKWQLRLFGSYVGPINIFRQHNQPELAHLYETANPQMFGIGFGYQWDFRKSNLIVATRQ